MMKSNFSFCQQTIRLLVQIKVIALELRQKAFFNCVRSLLPVISLVFGFYSTEGWLIVLERRIVIVRLFDVHTGHIALFSF